MKKKDIIFWWVVALISLFLVYKILEFNEKCKEPYKKYQKEMQQKGMLDQNGHVIRNM